MAAETKSAPAEPTTTGGKNIILCSDGTGARGGAGKSTNVWRIYNAADLKSRHGVRQIACYDDGVGTESLKLLKILGGAFGWGLSRNVRDLYTYLVNNYETGDRIYLFGFSRGAYTVRSLAGMIGVCGIYKRAKTDTWKDVQKKVQAAWKVYRGERRRQRPFLTRLAQMFGGNPAGGTATESHVTQARAGGEAAEIAFLGVWDTVDAVGVPIDELRNLLDLFFCNNFHRHDLGAHIKSAAHALAIDDERKTFHPVMFDEDLTKERGAATQVHQTWFAGVHTNVGGGYPKQGLSYFSLRWMIRHAEDAGLKFVKDDWPDGNADAKQYDSRAGFAAYYRYTPRDIQKIVSEYSSGKPVVHASVMDRIRHGRLGYAPGNLPDSFTTDDIGYHAPESDALGAGHGLHAAAEALCAGEHKKRPLEQARGYITCRRWLHFLLIAITLLVVYWMLKLDPDKVTAPDPRTWWQTAIHWVFSGIGMMIPWDWLGARIQSAGEFSQNEPARFLIVFGTLLAMLWLSRWCRARIHAINSRFWVDALREAS